MLKRIYKYIKLAIGFLIIWHGFLFVMSKTNSAWYETDVWWVVGGLLALVGWTMAWFWAGIDEGRYRERMGW